MDRETLVALEFEPLKALIAPSLRTSLGATALARLVPLGDPTAIRLAVARAVEATRYRREEGNLPLRALPDPAPLIERLKPEGASLDGIGCARLVATLVDAESLKRHMAGLRARFPLLDALASELPDLREVTRRIAGRIGEDGAIDDAASPALAKVRRRIASLEARLQRSLEGIVEQGTARGILQDTYVSVRNGRFVIPVRADAKGSIAGIVHGASSTGATLFVEPLATLDLNNDLVTLREQESAEVRRILAEWSGRLRVRLPEIESACSVLGTCDLIAAIGSFSAGTDAVGAREPGKNGGDGGRLTLDDARHPILDAGMRARGGSPVPLSVSFEARGGVLVLSGPNAGGKTVALKTIGILVLMNQAGIPVPARVAVLPIFRHVHADIGDHQSITENLSTFSARMTRVAAMMHRGADASLVLLDEVGAGTDVEEAGALAVSIVEKFRGAGAAVVATTHLDALKAYAETAPGALNAAMDVDAETLRPTYRLQPGTAGRSGGIALAERVGLPAEVVSAARARLSTAHRETEALLGRLRRAAEERDREIASLRLQRRQELDQIASERRRFEEEAAALRSGLERRIEEALASIERDRERLLAEIRDRTIALQLKSESRRAVRDLQEKHRRAIPAPPPAPRSPQPQRALTPGTRVWVNTLAGREEGTLESGDEHGPADVLVRGKRLRVRMEDVSPIDSPASEQAGRGPRVPEGVRLESRAARLEGDVPMECLLLGATVDEALDRVDKFLDDAFLAGHNRVRIVHGHGTGRLRSAVRKFLRSHPHVESAGPAAAEEGGDGATIAVLRA